MNKLILYSTGCPKCNVLKKKLAKAGIEYEENNNIEEMQSLGIKSVPVLSVNGELLPFVQANDYINNLSKESED